MKHLILFVLTIIKVNDCIYMDLNENELYENEVIVFERVYKIDDKNVYTMFYNRKGYIKTDKFKIRNAQDQYKYCDYQKVS